MTSAELLELAWAAGFFDGEGHTGAFKRKQGFWDLNLTVAQSRTEPLLRFSAAVHGMGRIYGPYRYGGQRGPFWQWRATSFADAQAVFCLLWPFLSRPKREQGLKAFSSYRPDLPEWRDCESKGHRIIQRQGPRTGAGMWTRCATCDVAKQKAKRQLRKAAA